MTKVFLAIIVALFSGSAALAQGASGAGLAGQSLETPAAQEELERQRRERLLEHADPADRKKVQDLHNQLRDIEKHIKDDE